MMNKTGAELIVEERQRQIEKERWTAEHDDQHRYGDLAVVAATLASYGTDAIVEDQLGRGTGDDCWGLIRKHSGNRIRCLTIAGALIAAEIDRLQRRRNHDERPRED